MVFVCRPKCASGCPPCPPIGCGVYSTIVIYIIYCALYYIQQPIYVGSDSIMCLGALGNDHATAHKRRTRRHSLGQDFATMRPTPPMDCAQIGGASALRDIVLLGSPVIAHPWRHLDNDIHAYSCARKDIHTYNRYAAGQVLRDRGKPPKLMQSWKGPNRSCALW